MYTYYEILVFLEYEIRKMIFGLFLYVGCINYTMFLELCRIFKKYKYYIEMENQNVVGSSVTIKTYVTTLLNM